MLVSGVCVWWAWSVGCVVCVVMRRREERANEVALMYPFALRCVCLRVTRVVGLGLPANYTQAQLSTTAPSTSIAARGCAWRVERKVQGLNIPAFDVESHASGSEAQKGSARPVMVAFDHRAPPDLGAE